MLRFLANKSFSVLGQVLKKECLCSVGNLIYMDKGSLHVDEKKTRGLREARKDQDKSQLFSICMCQISYILLKLIQFSL